MLLSPQTLLDVKVFSCHSALLCGSGEGHFLKARSESLPKRETNTGPIGKVVWHTATARKGARKSICEGVLPEH